MKRCIALILFVSLASGAGLLPPFTCIAAAQDCEQWAGKVVSVQGRVEVKREGGTQWQPATLNQVCCPGDVIRVLDRSRADIALPNQPVLRLDQNSTLTLRGLKEKKTSIVELFKGAAHFFSRGPRSLEVNTAFVNAGVEGTEFFVRVDDDRAVLTIFEGRVLAANAEGSLAIESGQSAEAVSGKAPAARAVVRPRDAVRWALYYPPVLSGRPADFAGLAESDRASADKSMAAFSRGDITGALETLGGTPEKARDARLFCYRASLLLAVGRVDEAQKDIEASLAAAPGNSDAQALLSIIAVTQNDKDNALALGKKAVEADPASATARLAMSYAQQAHFDLHGALASLEEAVRANPGSALAWARLAELRQAFGRLGDSLEAALKAAALNPDLSRSQTVLGFAYLTQIRTADAAKAFLRAIEKDQADPLPRLGLGLARIRDGHLDDGRAELEIAVSLDPDSALLRSYLGKAYYEEKKDSRAAAQLDMAKNFDPRDPTAFFYAAILEQTTNLPVEALGDLGKAIELNDNRAVYRSRQLLDEDLAARSASLARIYADLGFQQLALAEGWKSVAADPANYSAHRFLADSYSALPRHEIARVSELLQSQLLQPLNLTALQPRLAESDLFVISGGGPAAPSFNEYNPLFNRDRVALQASGVAGGNDTYGGEAVASGVYGRSSFSAGYYGYQTDGFRPNDDLEDRVANAFCQVSLSPATSVQAEYRFRDTEKGDTVLRFFPDDFKPKERTEDQYRSLRFGGSHSFAPGSILLGNFMYHEADRSVHDNPDPIVTLFDLKGEDSAYSGELQYLHRSERFSVIGGAGYFDIKSEDTITIELNIPEMPFPMQDTMVSDWDTRHTNLYLYSSVHYPGNVVVTLGGSGDFFNSQDLDREQFNPKLGITWNPVPATTVRAAAFRSLKRTLLTNQTLEPTQVAGFNQFYDDDNATDSWRYGVALDQRVTAQLRGGAEYSRRDMEIPYIDLSGEAPVTRLVDWSEDSGRAYLYWTPHRLLSLSAEYAYERLERAAELAAGAKTVTTHRLPLGVNVAHSSGLSLSFTATYFNQRGDFERQGELGTFVHGEDKFWLCDAAVSYRLPGRYGSISAGAKNLFDESFTYFDTDPMNPTIAPESMFFVRFTLSF